MALEPRAVPEPLSSPSLLLFFPFDFTRLQMSFGGTRCTGYFRGEVIKTFPFIFPKPFE